MKIAAKLFLVVAVSLVITAVILTVINVRSTVASGYIDIRFPEEIQKDDSRFIKYMAFWRREDTECIVADFKLKDEIYLSPAKKKQDGFYASVRTGTETPGNPFKKRRFYFQSYVVVATADMVYLAELEERSDPHGLQIKSLKEIRRLTRR